jgi:hypothetical protein
MSESPAVPEKGCAPKPADGSAQPDVFGEVLPTASGDELAEGWGEGWHDAVGGREESLRREVPPHHG